MVEVAITEKLKIQVMAGISAILWVTALFLPTFWVDVGENSAMYDGLEVLFLGPLSFMAGVLSWYANIYWFYATIRMAFGVPPGPILVTLNTILAASFLLGFQMFGSNESSTGPAMPQIGAGIWLLAFMPGLIVSLGMAIRRSRQAVGT